MKKYLSIALLLLMLVVPVFAQNDDLTIEPVATEAATVEAPAGDVNINVEAPEPAPAPAAPDVPFERLVLLGALILMVIDKISGHFLSIRLAKSIPPEWRDAAGTVVENAQRTGLQAAHSRVKQTTDTWDDTLLVEGAKIIGWEFVTNPDGSVTPRRIQLPVNPVTPGG